jgi:hypothetical protein
MKGGKNMSWLKKVKNYVKEYGDSCEDGPLFVIIPQEEVDGIGEWLEHYVDTDKGSWLWYDFKPITNAPEFYILGLHA